MMGMPVMPSLLLLRSTTALLMRMSMLHAMQKHHTTTSGHMTKTYILIHVLACARLIDATVQLRNPASCTVLHNN
jgi:hypothetical protein